MACRRRDIYKDLFDLIYAPSLVFPKCPHCDRYFRPLSAILAPAFYLHHEVSRSRLRLLLGD